MTGRATGGATSARRSVHLTRRWVEPIALSIVVFVAGLGVFWHAAHHVPYHQDEGDYIYTARYFDYFFLQRDLDNEAWGDNLWTRTQPMLTRYLVGAWLWARGNDLSTMPQPGTPIQDWFLVEARIPSVVIAAGALVVLYWLGYLLAGSPAGLVAAGLVLVNPLMREHLVRVIPEAALTLLLLLAVWLALVGVRRGRRGSLPLGWAALTGLALGLALQAKLTAVLSLAAVAGWALIVASAAWWRGRSERDGVARAVWESGRGWGLALVVALVVFVVTNPYLYDAPLQHTQDMFDERETTMQGQRGGSPQAATGGLLDRFSYVIGGSLILQLHWQHDIDIRVWHGFPLAALLAPFGLGWLLLRLRRAWREGQTPAPEGLLLLTTAVYLVGIGITIGLKWYRYLVPTYVLVSLLAGIGAVALLDLALRGRRELAERRAQPARTTSAVDHTGFDV